MCRALALVTLLAAGCASAPTSGPQPAEEPPREAPVAKPEPPRDPPREHAMSQEDAVEVLIWAVQAWDESGGKHQAEVLEREVRARRMVLAGRTDPEAKHFREAAPGRGDVIELLHGAGQRYEAKGWETRGAACHRLAAQLAGEAHAEKARPASADDDAWRREMEARLRRFMERTERLEVHVKKLAERLEHLEIK